MSKKALIVGINYPGTSHALRGCVNDAQLINTTITTQFGFEDIRVLLDANATTANILESLEWLVKDAARGDILYFHYSGHGSQMYDTNGEEADGLDEIICPVDLDWKEKVIRDDDMKRIFDTVPNGVNLTVTLDCCNSGGGIDQNNQYQSLGQARTALAAVDGRFLPQPDLTPAQETQLEQFMGFKPRVLQRDVDSTGLLISGCQSHQTSADAYIDGRYIGACTHFLVNQLKGANYNITYKDLVDQMNGMMATHGFSQRPELNGPAALFSKSFLEQYEVPSISSGVEAPVVVDVTPVVVDVTPVVVDVAPVVVDVIEPAPVTEEPKKDKTKLYIAAGVIIAAAVAFFALS